MNWSYSTHTTLRRCQLQCVFAQVVASHNAKHPDRREAFVLKQLQHVSAWQGSVVHSVLATTFLDDIRAGRPVDAAALIAVGHDLARRQFAFSAQRQYRQPGQTKQAAGDAYCALWEHERGVGISGETLQGVYNNIALCFKHLAEQHTLLAELRGGTRFIAEESFRFVLDGVTVTAKLDLVFHKSDGKLAIVDWKVGRSETSDYSRQLLVYALVAVHCGRWRGLEPEDIELYEVNLLKNHVRQHSMSTEQLESAEDFVYRSILDFRTVVGNGTFEGLDFTELDVAARPTTCQHCNFASLCTRTLTAEDEPEAVEIVQGQLW